MAGAASPAGAAPKYEDASADGSVVFFSTTEQLVTGDTDNRRDIYERVFDPSVGETGAYVTREVSTGPVGGNDAYDATFEKASADGTKVFFSTKERLASEDTDQSTDVYVRDLEDGSTSLVSQGNSQCAPGCGNGGFDAGFAGATAGGNEVFFVTEEKLAPGDTDNTFDIYERNLTTEATVLVSAGGNGAFPASYWGASSNGAMVFFTTAEQLLAEDQDSAPDIYARDLAEGTTTLVSQGESSCAPTCGNGGQVPVFRGSSSDGSRVFFTTDEQLAEADGDGSTDVYARDLPDGPTTLISGATTEDVTATFAAASSDGATVFFNTSESLVGGDTNNANDVYEWSEGVTSLVTSGTCCPSSFDEATATGDVVFVTTTEPLVEADEDSSADLYAIDVETGAPSLLSPGEGGCAPGCGNGVLPVIFNAISADGSTAFFSTDESLAAEGDGDTSTDLYFNESGSGTVLASPNGFCPLSEGCDVVFSGISTSGEHVFFQTEERLSLEDGDSESDVYERSGGETRLVSTGNVANLGPTTPALTATNPVSPGESTAPAIIGTADAETSIKLYTTSNCSGTPVATGSSTELEAPGITVSVATGSTTVLRATATDKNGDTSQCSAGITYKQESPPPPPPPPPPGEEGSGTGTGTGSTGAGGESQPSNPRRGRGEKSVNYVTPETLITFGPSFKTRKRRPVFRFDDATGQPGTRFACRLDRHRWKSCLSPVKLRLLGLGMHVFRVKAVNALGVWDPRPDSRRFKVVR